MIAVVFAAALMAAAPAAGETGAQTAAKPTKAAKNDLVCKKESVVGTRMKSRICLSQAEWDQRAIDAKDQVDAAQRNRPLQTN
jgi:hypothetical protein